MEGKIFMMHKESQNWKGPLEIIQGHLEQVPQEMSRWVWNICREGDSTPVPPSI